MTNRRDFIKKSSMITAGSLIAPSFSYSSSIETAGKMDAGLQVYSVRNQLNEDFEGTMKKVAQVGYKLIEGYGLNLDGKYLGKVAADHYKKVVTDLGMNLIATHCAYFNHEDAPKMIDAARISGVDYLIIPSIPGRLRKDISGYQSVAENFNKIGEQCMAADLKFGYHNHAFEFDIIDNQVPQEILMNETDAEYVAFETDIFWCFKGGYDAVKLIEKYPGRVELFHVKDATAEKHEATVGEGVIDFKSIFEAGKANGLQYYFIEDERTDDPFGNIKADHDYIVAQDFS